MLGPLPSVKPQQGAGTVAILVLLPRNYSSPTAADYSGRTKTIMNSAVLYCVRLRGKKSEANLIRGLGVAKERHMAFRLGQGEERNIEVGWGKDVNL